jgi:hypothetical protein
MKPINNNNAITHYTNVPASTDVQTLIEENGSRVGLLIYNSSMEALYIRFEESASYNDFTLKIEANGLYEMPLNYFTGKVTGIWNDEDGFATITEIEDR